MSRLAVVVGFLGKLPFAGMTLYNLHYVAGLRELGYEVHYVERQNVPDEYYDPRVDAMTDDVSYGFAYLESILSRVGMATGQASLVDSEGNCRGSGWSVLEKVLRRADFVLDLADATWFDELECCPQRAFVDGDPLFTQVAMLAGGAAARSIARYDVLFTYGTRIGEPDCAIPALGREWLPTRPVITTSAWKVVPPTRASAPYTNVMSWSAWSEIELDGRTYGQKGQELARFTDLPERTGKPFRLAVGGPAPRDLLREHGWELVDPLDVTGTIDAYRGFIAGSRADFGIAKHAYVASRSGWFSDRSTCYLASGRPVLHQDTGYRDWLDVDFGVLPFSDMESLLRALERLDADYERHAAGARKVAEEHFEARTVIGEMLERAGFR